MAGDGPEEAIVIEELPFFFSGNSAEYTKHGQPGWRIRCVLHVHERNRGIANSV